MKKLNHNLPAPVDHIEINRRLSAVRYLSIPDPAFTLPYFKYTVGGRVETVYEPRNHRVEINEIVSSVESIRETFDELINSLRCRASYKIKLLAGLQENNRSLKQIIRRILKLNLKNYQPGNKDIIEKMILLHYLSETNRSRNNTLKAMPFVQILNLIYDFLSRSFEGYYGRYIDTEYFNLFIEKLKAEYPDHPLESLADSFKSEDWNFNEKLIRDSHACGSKNIIRKPSQTVFTDYNCETNSYDITDDGIIKILCVFTADIPKNTFDLKRMGVFINNYFTSSIWRKNLNKLLIEAYTIKPGSIIEFVPCKDQTLAVRHIAGNDCTADMNEFISDSDSMFYKITHMEKWIGYACILSSKLPGGEAVAIIDVINFKNTEIKLSLEMFEAMLDNISKDLKKQGFKYILIPEEKRMLTNINCDDIYKKYADSPGVNLYPETDFSINHILERHKGFHSLYSEQLLIVRDLMYTRATQAVNHQGYLIFQ